MRYSRLCQLLSNQGFDVVIAVIGLFKEIHIWNRENISNYIEIFIDTPLDELKRRDPKGLYKMCGSGKIKNVAGMDLRIDFPVNPNIHIKWSDKKTIDSMFNELLEKYVEFNNK
jgi:cytidine diphosphoramidate kinase